MGGPEYAGLSVNDLGVIAEETTENGREQNHTVAAAAPAVDLRLQPTPEADTDTDSENAATSDGEDSGGSRTSTRISESSRRLSISTEPSLGSTTSETESSLNSADLAALRRHFEARGIQNIPTTAESESESAAHESGDSCSYAQSMSGAAVSDVDPEIYKQLSERNVRMQQDSADLRRISAERRAANDESMSGAHRESA